MVAAFFLMVVPNCEYGDNGVFLFADLGLVEFSTEDQLVDIAVASAKSFEQITEGVWQRILSEVWQSHACRHRN